MIRLAVLATLALSRPAAACLAPPPADVIRGSLVEAAEAEPNAAWYSTPTGIYGHGIMGSVPDARDLVAKIATEDGGCRIVITQAGDGHVFEDTAPRLVDVTGDGTPEIIAVRSSLDRGAQLVIYQHRDRALIEIAATPYIGKRNRWLAPAAAGDLDGDGYVEIAYVDRPHLAKILRIWRYAAGDFREVAAATGLTNHAIGDEVIHGGLRDCGQGPEIVLSDADRSRMLAVTYDGRTIRARGIGLWSNAAAKDAVACRR